MTGKELFELSERFHAKCEETLNEGECTGCEFKKETGVRFPCPEFYFRTEEQANEFLDFIGAEQQAELITDELLEHIPINKFSSPNFSGCEFHNCEIYRYGMNN